MESCDIVITCGGVGPTVDDCTVEAVALAANTHLAGHQGLEGAMRDYFGSQVGFLLLREGPHLEGDSELDTVCFIIVCK
jgi:molybdopterin-biosynthesis enzyme MoeA-like protein